MPKHRASKIKQKWTTRELGKHIIIDGDFKIPLSIIYRRIDKESAR